MRTEYLLSKQVDQVLSALTEENALVLRVCLHTGLRISDVLELRTEQLKPHFWVQEKKTGKSKQVGLPEPLLSEVRAAAGEEWAFPGRNPKKHRSRQAVWKDVKRASKAFRMKQNVAPHSIRKVYAVELMRKYGDLERVKRALNHSSDMMTMVYALADIQLEQKKNFRKGRRRS